MAALATFECRGVVIAVRSADAASLDALPAYLPPGARTSDRLDADVQYTVARDAGVGRESYAVTLAMPPGPALEIACAGERGLALEALAHDAEFRIACEAPDDAFVHAGVVAVDGRAVVIPGYSFAGKSTLVAALVRDGAVYYSDEYAVLTRDGLVAPFARRIATRDVRGEPGPRLRPEELGGVAGVTPIRIGAVITTRYRPGTRWHPEPLSRGQMVLTLLEHAVTARTRPGHTLDCVSAAVGPAAVGLRGDRGPAEATARAIVRHVRQARGR